MQAKSRVIWIYLCLQSAFVYTFIPAARNATSQAEACVICGWGLKCDYMTAAYEFE